VRIFSFEIHYYCPEEHVDCDVRKTHLGCTAGSGFVLLSAEPLSDAVPEPATLVYSYLQRLAGVTCDAWPHRKSHQLINA
jgi:hypothetical protein